MRELASPGERRPAPFFAYWSPVGIIVVQNLAG
jgi:hypothetical protein